MIFLNYYWEQFYDGCFWLKIEKGGPVNALVGASGSRRRESGGAMPRSKCEKYGCK